MKNIIIISIAFIFIFSSCEKKLDIDLPESEKKIVVNGIVTPDSLMKVRISKSMNVLDNENVEYLSTASVKLFINDVLSEELNHVDSGLFVSTVFPEINTDYKLTVDYPGLNSVNADINLIQAVQIASLDTISEMQIENYGDGYIDTSYIMHFEVEISDNADNADYYYLSLRAMMPITDSINGEPVIVGYEEENMYFDSNDPIFRNSKEFFTLNGMNGVVFKDEMFNGNGYTIDMEHYIDKNIEFREKQFGMMYYVKLLTITEDIYNYIISFNLYRNTEFNPFAQPVQILSNVENGLGLFSGYTMDVDSVLIDF